MEKTTKKYVEYLYPGFIVSESSSMEIEHSDPMKVEVKEHVIGFRFYEKDFIYSDGQQFEGQIKNMTNWFYIGKRLTLAEVKSRFNGMPKYKTLIDNMECNEISSVCMTEYGNFMPMEKEDITLNEYVTEHGKEANALKMFQALKKHLGKSVSYRGWWYGVAQNETGILKDVNFFTNVEIGCHGIPFVGYGSAISSIILDETGEELYSNPHIEYGYDRRSPEKIEESRRMFFGDTIVDKQRSRRMKAEAIRKQKQEQADLEAKKKKYIFMREGLAFVKSEEAENWMQYVDNNTNDAYSCCIVEATLLCLKQLQEGATCEVVEKVYVEMGLSGYMAGAVSSMIARFSTRGSEFKQYWNKKFGISGEEKGTVNPAILVLS
ncbi:MAG: hypothetical protein HFH08_01435 [Bacilli bacterium]|nr:hypothetical protein [Bacilli bacterium]